MKVFFVSGLFLFCSFLPFYSVLQLILMYTSSKLVNNFCLLAMSYPIFDISRSTYVWLWWKFLFWRPTKELRSFKTIVNLQVWSNTPTEHISSWLTLWKHSFIAFNTSRPKGRDGMSTKCWCHLMSSLHSLKRKSPQTERHLSNAYDAWWAAMSGWQPKTSKQVGHLQVGHMPWKSV